MRWTKDEQSFVIGAARQRHADSSIQTYNGIDVGNDIAVVETKGANQLLKEPFSSAVQSSITDQYFGGHRTLVFSLEVFEFPLRFQQAFRQFTAFLLVEITTGFAFVGMTFQWAV